MGPRESQPVYLILCRISGGSNRSCAPTPSHPQTHMKGMVMSTSYPLASYDHSFFQQVLIEHLICARQLLGPDGWLGGHWEREGRGPFSYKPAASGSGDTTQQIIPTVCGIPGRVSAQSSQQGCPGGLHFRVGAGKEDSLTVV